LQAGDLVAAQPAITLANPLLALGWGFVIFAERIDLSLWTLVAVAGAVAVVVGTIVLTREAASTVAPATAPG
jgi:ABC-type xylose transport system permease subunit